jgi:hypothetical protein
MLECRDDSLCRLLCERGAIVVVDLLFTLRRWFSLSEVFPGDDVGLEAIAVASSRCV